TCGLLSARRRSEIVLVASVVHTHRPRHSRRAVAAQPPESGHLGPRKRRLRVRVEGDLDPPPLPLSVLPGVARVENAGVVDAVAARDHVAFGIPDLDLE